MLTQQDYKDAILVQDACNLSGVAHAFRKLVERIEEALVERGDDKFESNRHPLAVMYTSKLLSLTRGELQPVQDLRILPGWHLTLFARCFSTALTNMRALGDQDYGLVVDSKFLDGHVLSRWFAVKLAELTHCESMDVFGQAYEACKYVMDLEEENVEQELQDGDWLHRVMMPDTPIERQKPPDKESEVDWACECGASGVTRMLEFVEEANKFRCPACGSQNITAVSASLKAELNTPRMLAFALGQLNADKVQAAGYTLAESDE